MSKQIQISEVPITEKFRTHEVPFKDICENRSQNAHRSLIDLTIFEGECVEGGVEGGREKVNSPEDL